MVLDAPNLAFTTFIINYSSPRYIIEGFTYVIIAKVLIYLQQRFPKKY